MSTVLAILFGTTTLICFKVYRQRAKASKWMANRKMDLPRRVFWQSFWYVMAFFITLPYLMVSYYMPYPTIFHFELNMVLTAILAPLQGLLNSLIYFQRSKGMKMFSVLCCCCCWCWRKTFDGTSDGSDGSKPMPSTVVDETGSRRPESVQTTDGEENHITDGENKKKEEEEEATQNGGDDANTNNQQPDLVSDTDVLTQEDEGPSLSDFTAVLEYWELNETNDDDNDNNNNNQGKEVVASAAPQAEGNRRQRIRSFRLPSRRLFLFSAGVEHEKTQDREDVAEGDEAKPPKRSTSLDISTLSSPTSGRMS
eukprot:CAMPEP_0116552362 /NCGR_PEP_ID=MMETSP0397-20121206/6449_1 /TAXON_ID=216820 /ORGANISM="Cyclophora tenuis, Strain ECT3854" /LENGTH=310 /DNA_ID=CAMNT_0004077313 /DNA_START=37 /DNA_END=972 /DNA_ORIENTATION=+